VYLCNFDPTFPIEVGFDIHDSHHNIRMNRHDSFEVIYVYQGQGLVQVQERRFSVSQGNLVVLGPNLYHQIACRPGTKLRLPFLHFQSGMLTGSPGGEEERLLAPFLCQQAEFPNVVSRSSGVPDEVLKLMLKIHGELPPRNDVARLAVKTYLRMLLLLLLQHYDEHVGMHDALKRRQQDLQRLSPLFQFIDQNYGEMIHTHTAARLCAMSKVQFMRFFKKVTGQTFHTYLQRFRVARAQALLSTSDKSIADISARLGFCSQSHFGRTFTTLVGLTPLAYRCRFGKEGAHNDDHRLAGGVVNDKRWNPSPQEGAKAKLQIDSASPRVAKVIDVPNRSRRARARAGISRQSRGL
jgi:AraC-like DNA-binding protein